MTFIKGQSGNPSGKPVGALSAKTLLGREAIAKFVDGNAERLNEWLDAIAQDSPKDAFNCFMQVVEYHIPKLQRSEVDLTVKKQSMTYEEMIALRDMMQAMKQGTIEHKPELVIDAVDVVEVQEGEIIGKPIQRETTQEKPKRKRLTIDERIAQEAAKLKQSDQIEQSLTANTSKEE